MKSGHPWHCLLGISIKSNQQKIWRVKRKSWIQSVKHKNSNFCEVPYDDILKCFPKMFLWLYNLCFSSNNMLVLDSNNLSVTSETETFTIWALLRSFFQQVVHEAYAAMDTLVLQSGTETAHQPQVAVLRSAPSAAAIPVSTKLHFTSIYFTLLHLILDNLSFKLSWMHINSLGTDQISTQAWVWLLPDIWWWFDFYCQWCTVEVI